MSSRRGGATRGGVGIEELRRRIEELDNKRDEDVEIDSKSEAEIACEPHDEDVDPTCT